MKSIMVTLVLSILLGCSNKEPNLIGEVPSDLKEKLVYVEGHLPYYFPELSEFGTLRDGEYIGDLKGSMIDRGEVLVTIKNGRILSVKILNMKVFAPELRKENRMEDVFIGLPSEVVYKQSPHVDTVSSATGTTHVFKICVTRALWKSSMKDDPLESHSPY